MAAIATDQSRETLDINKKTELIRSIQERLRDIGIYSGPLDGILGTQTAAAIESYQRQTGQTVTGRPTQALFEHLDSASEQAKRLLRKLEETRRQQIEDARQALDTSPEAQHLLARGRAATATTASPAACRNSSDAHCLIDEAVAAMTRVTVASQRYWTFDQLALARALGGDVEGALAIIVRIGDSRLLMAALGKVAQASMVGGQPANAEDIARAIPNAKLQVETYLALAGTQFSLDRLNETRRFGSLAEETSARLTDPLKRVPLLAKLSEVLYRANRQSQARALLAEAKQSATRGQAGLTRAIALAPIGFAHVIHGDIPQATAVLRQLAGQTSQADFLRKRIAAAAAGRGDFATATRLIPAFTDPVLRAQAHVALARHRRGKIAGTDLTTAEGALATAPSGYRLDYTRALLAAAWQRLGRAEDALIQTDGITDKALRARTLWQLAGEVWTRGDADRATKLEDRALRTVKALDGGLDRVWSYAEMAVARQAMGRNETAKTLFNQAVRTARSIGNDWFRARALTRTAMTALVMKSDERRFPLIRDAVFGN